MVTIAGVKHVLSIQISRKISGKKHTQKPLKIDSSRGVSESESVANNSLQSVERSQLTEAEKQKQRCSDAWIRSRRCARTLRRRSTRPSRTRSTRWRKTAKSKFFFLSILLPFFCQILSFSIPFRSLTDRSKHTEHEKDLEVFLSFCLISLFILKYTCIFRSFSWPRNITFAFLFLSFTRLTLSQPHRTTSNLYYWLTKKLYIFQGGGFLVD